MPEMSLTEAAKWAGVTRPTIFKALTSGRLSGHKDDSGQWRINPAELERVYAPGKPVDVSGNGKLSTSDIGYAIKERDREIALLREVTADLRTERDRLLGLLEANTRLLTHEQQKAPEAIPQALASAAASPILPRARAWVRAQLGRL